MQLQRVPRSILEPLLALWHEDHPEAAQWLCWRQLAGESAPRQVVTRDGLYAFRDWVATEPSGTYRHQQALLLHVVSLSYEAGLITDPEECKRLCRPQARPPM
jgi:hypothetical protein